jgi:glucose-6-phosphate isomerase
MILPEGVFIDGRTGAMPKANEHYTKRVRELAGLYRDGAAFDAYVAAHREAVGYEVAGYRQDGSDIFFGTTTMSPGRIGDEYFMTRGHYHVRRDCGEVYYTQSGHGVLLLQTREGESREVEMAPGVCAFIPPDWAHRSVNTGDTPLVFAWFCQPTAGHDYGDILTHGMRRLAVERGGKVAFIANPTLGA